MSVWIVEPTGLRLSDPDASGDRTVWIAPYQQAAAQETRFTAASTAVEVGAWVFGSGDGRNRYRAIVDGAGNAAIQTVSNGGTPVTVTNVVGDLPSGAVPCTAAQGPAIGAPAQIAVRVYTSGLNPTIEMWIGGVLKLRHTASDATLTPLRSFGIEGRTGGTRVINPQVADIVPQTEPTAELLCALCGGELWVAQSEAAGLSRIAQNVVPPDGLVSAIDFEQKGLIVGGQRARVFDPVARTVTAWSPTDGTLPGQTTPGTTTASRIVRYNARVWANDAVSDRQNIYWSKLYDRDYWLLTTDAGDGGSLTASRAAKVGQAIVSMIEAAGAAMTIGCAQSFWRLYGDPLGPCDVGPITLGSGLLTPDGLATIDDGRVAALSTDGLAMISGDSFSKVSKPVLTELVEPEASTLQAGILVRDPRRGITWMFLTRIGASDASPSVHVAYHERVGGWSAGEGGFFPVTFPSRIGPTAAVNWNGQVVLGGTDGRLYVLDDAQVTDDGTPIDFRVPLTLVAPSNPEHEAVIHELSVVLADTSGACTATLYSGRTAEEALVGAERRERWSRSCAARRTLMPQGGRGRALVLELSSSAATRVAIEQVSVHASLEPAYPTPANVAVSAKPGPDAAVVTESLLAGPGGSTAVDPSGEMLVYSRPFDDALTDTSLDDLATADGGGGAGGGGGSTYKGGIGDGDGGLVVD